MFWNWWNTVHADEVHTYFASSNPSTELQVPISNHLLTFILRCLTDTSNISRLKQNLILNLPSPDKQNNLSCSFIGIPLSNNGTTINLVPQFIRFKSPFLFFIPTSNQAIIRSCLFYLCNTSQIIPLLSISTTTTRIQTNIGISYLNSINSLMVGGPASMWASFYYSYPPWKSQSDIH